MEHIQPEKRTIQQQKVQKFYLQNQQQQQIEDQDQIEPKMELSLSEKVDLLVKRHKDLNDKIYTIQNNNKKLKSKKIIQVNTSKSRGEIKVLKYLCAQYGWRECWNEDGHIMWSGLSIPDSQLSICLDLKINRLPEMHELTNKKISGFYLNKFREYFPEEYDFFPRTFLIPEEYDEFKNFSKSNTAQLFIAKPSHGCQGDGIKLFKQVKDLPVNQYNQRGNEMVVQHYINKPMLLDNKKFDFRLYVLISSIDPLIVYVNEEGLVRFCSEDYQEPTQQNWKNMYIHLTNYSLNKDHPGFKPPQEDTDILEENTASKRTFTSVLKSLKKQKGIDIEQLKEDINQIIKKFIISMYPFILYSHKTAFNNKKSKCFHVLGFDVLIDETGKPWLIEANANPSFNIDHEVYNPQKKQDIQESPLDKYIKSIVVGDAIMLMQKSVKKQELIGNNEVYRSWKQLIFGDQDALENEQTTIIKKCQKFTVNQVDLSLSLAQPMEISENQLILLIKIILFVKQIVNYYFKKITGPAAQMNFYDFIQSIENIAEKLKGRKITKEEKFFEVSTLINRILGNM